MSSAAGAASSKALAYLADADKALKRTTIFGFGKNQKYEDAAELFTKAGNAFKLANQWQSAGEAFLKSASSIANTESPSDAVNSYTEAGAFVTYFERNDYIFNKQRIVSRKSIQETL